MHNVLTHTSKDVVYYIVVLRYVRPNQLDLLDSVLACTELSQPPYYVVALLASIILCLFTQAPSLGTVRERAWLDTRPVLNLG